MSGVWLRVGVTEKRFVKMNYRVRNRNATTPYDKSRLRTSTVGRPGVEESERRGRDSIRSTRAIQALDTTLHARQRTAAATSRVASGRSWTWLIYVLPGWP